MYSIRHFSHCVVNIQTSYCLLSIAVGISDIEYKLSGLALAGGSASTGQFTCMEDLGCSILQPYMFYPVPVSNVLFLLAVSSVSLMTAGLNLFMEPVNVACYVIHAQLLFYILPGWLFHDKTFIMPNCESPNAQGAIIDKKIAKRVSDG
jgi:hypothetical protein